VDAATREDGPYGDALGDRRRIGDILLELGLITPVELEHALERQRLSGGRIGEILIEQGAMTRLDLASALAEYWEPQRYTPVVNRPISLAGAGRGDAGPAAQDHEMLATLERRLAEAERRLGDEGAPADRGGSLESLDSRIDALDALRRAEAIAVGARLTAVEQELAELAETRRADALALDARLAALEATLAELQSRLPG
jgi:hypothetical protein